MQTRINNYLKVLRSGYPNRTARIFSFDDFDVASRARAWGAVQALVGTERKAHAVSVWRVTGKLGPIPTTVPQIGDSVRSAAAFKPPSNKQSNGAQEHDRPEEAAPAAE